MKQYLLSIQQPDGPTPPPEMLQKVMREVGSYIEETKSAGAWVFNFPILRQRGYFQNMEVIPF